MSTEHYYPQPHASLRNRAIDNAYLKMVEKLQTFIYNNHIKHRSYDKITDDPVVLQMFAQADSIRDGKTEGNYFLITFTPPDGDVNTTWDLLHKSALRFSTYKNLVGPSYIWSLEQRSDDINNPYGPHLHMICDTGPKTKSNIITRAHAALKHFFPDITTNSVDIKYCSLSKVKYILGYKSDTHKRQLVDVDQKLRELYGYTAWYEAGSADLYNRLKENHPDM